MTLKLKVRARAVLRSTYTRVGNFYKGMVARTGPYQDLQTGHDRLEENLAESQTAAGRLERDLDGSVSENKGLTGEIGQLRRNLANQMTAAEGLRGQINEQGAELGVARHRVGYLEGELARHVEESDKAEEDLAVANVRLRYAQNDLGTSHEMVQALTKEVRLAKGVLGYVKHSFARVRREMAGHVTRLYLETHADDLAVVVDHHDNILGVSSETAKLLGRDQEEMVGHDVYGFVNDPDSLRARLQLRDRSASREKVLLKEVILCGKKNTRPLNLVYRPLTLKLGLPWLPELYVGGTIRLETKSERNERKKVERAYASRFSSAMETVRAALRGLKGGREEHS